MTVGAVVPAAGRGARVGSPQNKIWIEIAGRPLIEWTIAALQRCSDVATIVVAARPDEVSVLGAHLARWTKVRAVVPGGDTRSESVRAGLAALPPECDIVLVHDAARPAVSERLVAQVARAAREHGAAVPGLPVSDTLKRTGSDGRVLETVDREGLWRVQTPQGARVADLRAAFEILGSQAMTLTDEAAVLEMAGYPVFVVPGEERNIKVTYPEDISRAAAILSGAACGPPEFRTGFGYDVHALAEGRPLWLGGERIPHDRGLVGHSDADVLLHAVCDALLGAAGMGDIGVLFPDSDPAHKDRPSIEFVLEVAERLRAGDWRVENVDVTLLAERPRIGPYRDAMASNIARALGTAEDRINIKATTSERLGFVGRAEGLACWAVAAISRAQTPGNDGG